VQKFINKYFISCLLVFFYLAGLILLFAFYRYQANFDTMGYIDSAQKYLAGHWHEAVSAYWSPFFIWLLILPAAAGLEPVLAAKLLLLLGGGIILFILRLLLVKFRINRLFSRIILLCMIPVLYYNIFYFSTPEIYLLIFLMLYVYFLIRNEYDQKQLYGFLSGIAGGLAFLTQAYALPFFIVHFSVIHIIFFFRIETYRRRRSLILNFLFGLAGFILLAGPWIYILNGKYQKYPAGSKSEYNIRLAGNGNIHPSESAGFFAPPDKYSICSWTDPTYLIRLMPESGILQSAGSFTAFARRLLKNLFRLFMQLAPLTSAVILVYFYKFIINPQKNFKKTLDPFYLFTVLFFPSGYLLLYIGDERYFWLVNILTMLMGARIVIFLLKKFRSSLRPAVFAMLLFCLSYLFFPSLLLLSAINAGKKNYNTAMQIRDKLKISGITASDINFEETVKISYYNKCINYGLAAPHWSPDELITELKKINIDYYFVWNENLFFNNKIKILPEITGGNIPGLKIYAVNKKLLK